MSDRIRIIKHEPILGAACDLATLAYFPGPGLGYFAGLEEAMKLNQPREAMPLTVWIALAALAFWSADGSEMSFELMFDGFESGTDVHATFVANLI